MEAALAQMKKELAAQKEEMTAQRRELQAQKGELASQRELAESTMGADPAAKEPLVRIYGFADMGFQKMFASPDSPVLWVVPSTASTFVMGNLNLYVDAQPIQDWSLMVETRLTNYPNGADQVGTSTNSYSRTNTRVSDVTSASGGWSHISWGSIVLERAYLEWHKWDQLGIRVGEFLTPFGIWNIDHGTPTLISLMVPQFEVNEMFPTHQVGLELFGHFRRASWDLGYYAYVSNGRTPGQIDLTEAKTAGGRIYLQTTRPARLTLGASGFWGRNVDTRRTAADATSLAVRTDVTVQYDEFAVGGDLSLDAGRFRLRSEFAFRHVAYQPGKRDTFAGIGGVYVPDHNEWDGYLLAAYLLPWLGLEPYFYAELYRWPTPVTEGQWAASAGLNVHFNAYAQLKLQYSFQSGFKQLAHLFSLDSDDSVHFLAARLVLAF